MKRPLWWLPRSLMGRVFALYCAALLAFAGGGLVLLFQHQHAQEIERVQWHAKAMSSMLVPVVTDQLVRSDTDGLRHTLGRAIDHTDLASASLIGRGDHLVEASRTAASGAGSQQPAPAWWRQMIASQLPDIRLPIVSAGRDHGTLLLRMDAQRVADSLWQQAVYALWLTAIALGGGLFIIRLLLVRWLGSIGDIQSLEAQMHAGGGLTPAPALAPDTPLELRQTYDVLSRAAQAIHVEREQAAVTLGAIADAVFTLNAEGRVVYANAAVEAVFGQWAQSFLGLHLRDVLPELVLGNTLEPWHGRHARHSSLGGREVVMDTTLSVIEGPEGSGALGFVLACRDVTETHALNERLRSEMRSRESALNALRRVLEGLRPAGAIRPMAGADDIEAITQLISDLVLQLQERGEQLAAIFELSPDGFVSFDAQRIVGYVSPTFTRLTGLSAAQVIGLDDAGFASALRTLCVDPEQGRRSIEALRLRADTSDRREVIELARPARRMLELGLREGSSRAISQVLYLRDVTHETEVDRMKSEFLSTAAHELRTPMASIYGFSELMMHRQMPPERQRQLIETVHRQTEQMITIVDELLDLARIEARRGKDFVIEDIRLQDLVAGIVRDFKPPEQRPGPVMGPDPGDLWVRADRSKTIQAIANVLSNAYKYSPAGGDVRLRLVSREAAEGESGPQAGIELEDQGLGMTPEQLARIGERFYRADTSGRIPGTGLGMSIVKEVMALQGGRLELHSEHGRGTRIRLWLPALTTVPDTTTPALASA